MRFDGYRPPDDWRPPTRPWVFALVWVGILASCAVAFYVLGWLAWWLANLLA